MEPTIDEDKSHIFAGRCIGCPIEIGVAQAGGHSASICFRCVLDG
jgi:hypothetical protein